VWCRVLLIRGSRIVLQLVPLAAHHLPNWLGRDYWLRLEPYSVVRLGLSHAIGLNLGLNLNPVASVVVVDESGGLGPRDDPVACATHGSLVAATHVLCRS